jgi:hypothetical protein
MRPRIVVRRKADPQRTVSADKRLFLRTGRWWFREPHPFPTKNVEEMRRDYELVRTEIRAAVKARFGSEREPWFEKTWNEILDREIFGC